MPLRGMDRAILIPGVSTPGYSHRATNMANVGRVVKNLPCRPPGMYNIDSTQFELRHNFLTRIIHESEIVQTVCHCFAEAVWSETGCPGTACAKQWHTFMNDPG
jgi:hypothetical protein